MSHPSKPRPAVVHDSTRSIRRSNLDAAPEADGAQHRVIPLYRAHVEISRHDVGDPDMRVEITGPAQFVARLLADTGSAFEDDATR